MKFFFWSSLTILNFLPFFFLIFKIIFFCILAILLRGTLPRYRFDQLIQLTWKHYILLWLGFLFLNISYLYLFL